jgi:hypothetical protein
VKRHPDGRFRGNRAKSELTPKVLISRWVEQQVIRLKIMGASFEAIAGLLTQSGRGDFVPTVCPPSGVTFPPGYSISKMGCCKAYRRALDREPSLEAREHLKTDIARSEELYLSLQPGIKKGDPKAIEAAIRILNHKAKIIGYLDPSKMAVNEGLETKRGENKEVVYSAEDDNETISMFREAVALLNRLKPTDQE